MTSLSSYQPFLIGDGQSKTGLFQYLESWVKPPDAFDYMYDAYVYRGTINKRNGYTPYYSTSGNGSLVYRDSSKVGEVSGAPVNTYAYNSTNGVAIPKRPIIADSVVIKAMTSAGIETWTASGNVLTGSLGDSGTINNTNGQWTLTLIGGRTIATGIEIWASYSYAVQYLTAGTVTAQPIMAIKTYIDESTNEQVTVVCDTKRASWYDFTIPTFKPINTISETLGNGDGTSNPQLFNPGWTNLAPYSISISDGTSTITDKGDGTFTASGNLNPGGTSTIDYATGAISLNLTAANTNTYTWTATLQGDYFTGNGTNFFNATNWKPSDTATGYLYLTNNVDRITLFDGINLARPAYVTKLSHLATLVNDIKTCLDIKIYKNRLLLIRPTLVGSNTPEAQSIRFSRQFIPQDLVSDSAGHGGNEVAPTGDWIMSSQFVRDIINVFFLNSTWIFISTNSDFSPFRWTKINSSKSTQAPYGSIAYDTECTSMGNKGLIISNGVSVNRYDESIIDQYLDIEPKSFGQCYGQRYDLYQQALMLYPDVSDASGSNFQTTSSRILVFNFLEKTWSIYKLPLSCLGLGQTTSDATWANFDPVTGIEPFAGQTWEEWDKAWNSYLSLADQPALLGGGLDGFVYELDSAETDNGISVFSNILTKKFNPFIETGQKASFGYLDVYYQVAPEVELFFNFYINNSNNAAVNKSMFLTGNINNDYAVQRIFLNVTGQFLQFQITDNGASNYKILGFILHCAPAGNLTPGTFL